MAVAWGTFMAIMTTEVNREIASRTYSNEESTLMQTGSHGRGGRDNKDDGDKFPGRPKRKFVRDSRRRSLTQRRRNIEQELAKLSANIRGSRGNVNRVCDETARRLRHVLGRRPDDVPIGRTGLTANESDHLLALMNRRGDRGTAIITAAIFRMLALLLLDLSTATHLHVFHQELEAQQRRREHPVPSSSMTSPMQMPAEDLTQTTNAGTESVRVQMMRGVMEPQAGGENDEDEVNLMQNPDGPGLPEERVVEFEDDLRWKLVKARRLSPVHAKSFIVLCAVTFARGLKSKLVGVRQLSTRLTDLIDFYKDQLKNVEAKDDPAQKKWLKRFWRRIRNQARYRMVKNRLANRQPLVKPDDRPPLGDLQEHGDQANQQDVMVEVDSASVESSQEGKNNDAPEDGGDQQGNEHDMVADNDETDLMQRDSNWVQYVQEDLEALRRSGVRVGGHAQQLRTYCHEVRGKCLDKEAFEDLDALLAVYGEDQAEEARYEQVDRWALEWKDKVLPLLCSDPVIEIDTPDEAAMKRLQILDNIKNEANNKLKAMKARKQEELELQEAMEASRKVTKMQDKYEKPLGSAESTTGHGNGMEGLEGGVSSGTSTELLPVETTFHLSPNHVQVSDVMVTQAHVQGQGSQAAHVSFRVQVRLPQPQSAEAATQTGDE